VEDRDMSEALASGDGGARQKERERRESERACERVRMNKRVVIPSGSEVQKADAHRVCLCS
jgi:hypothetical protein